MFYLTKQKCFGSEWPVLGQDVSKGDGNGEET